MGRTKSPGLGIIGALIPVLFCGGFLVYFAGVEHWTGVPVGDALTPTVFGLGALTILFAIPLILRIARLVGPPSPRKPGSPPRRDPPEDERSDFDADAAIARYLARREAEGPAAAAPASAAGLRAPAPAFAPPPPTFGRKTR